jgi:hypothetical protein
MREAKDRGKGRFETQRRPSENRSRDWSKAATKDANNHQKPEGARSKLSPRAFVGEYTLANTLILDIRTTKL